MNHVLLLFTFQLQKLRQRVIIDSSRVRKTGVQMVQFPHVFRLGEFSSISNSAKGV